MAAPIRPQPAAPASVTVQMTLEEFLEWEEVQERRHEFVDGVVRAMTGTTDRHNAIVDNVQQILRGPARAAGCRSRFLDLQVRTPGGRIYYPDVVVRCGPYSGGDKYARTPCLIVEVTSPSTRKTDLETKRDDYRQIPSLRAYVIVEQAVRCLRVHVRRDDDTWTEWEASDVTGIAEVAPPCLDAVLTLDAVYEDTDVPTPPPDLRAYAPPPPDDEPTA